MQIYKVHTYIHTYLFCSKKNDTIDKKQGQPVRSRKRTRLEEHLLPPLLGSLKSTVTTHSRLILLQNVINGKLKPSCTTC